MTRNEQANKAGCIETVCWGREIFDVDSVSADRTVETARSLGASVYSHPFEGYAKQRNWPLENLPFSTEWVLLLDADERVPAALAEEIAHVVVRTRQAGPAILADDGEA